MMHNRVFKANQDKKAMELILSVLVLVITKRVPPECEVQKI